MSRDYYQSPPYIQPVEPGPARQAPQYEDGVIKLDPREWRGFDTSTGVEPGGFQVGPTTQTHQQPSTPAPGSSSGAPGLDLSGLMSGQIFGLPSWLVIGAAVWFLFFRKHR